MSPAASPVLVPGPGGRRAARRLLDCTPLDRCPAPPSRRSASRPPSRASLPSPATSSSSSEVPPRCLSLLAPPLIVSKPKPPSYSHRVPSSERGCRRHYHPTECRLAAAALDQVCDLPLPAERSRKSEPTAYLDVEDGRRTRRPSQSETSCPQPKSRSDTADGLVLVAYGIEARPPDESPSTEFAPCPAPGGRCRPVHRAGHHLPHPRVRHRHPPYVRRLRVLITVQGVVVDITVR